MAKNDHGRDLSASEMVEMLDEWVNANNYPEQIAAFALHMTTRVHRTLQQGCMRLFIACIEAWATQENFDARNEATIKMAKLIVEATGDKYDRQLPTI